MRRPPNRPKPRSEESAEAAPAHMTAADRAATLETLKTKSAELAKLQGERPLILPSVDRIAVGGVVQDWTGIPAGPDAGIPGRTGADAGRRSWPSASSARTTPWA